LYSVDRQCKPEVRMARLYTGENPIRPLGFPSFAKDEIELLEAQGRESKNESDRCTQAELEAAGGEAFLDELNFHSLNELPLHHEHDDRREFDDFGWGARHILPAPQYGQQ
jgi:hypothetical protein